MCLPCWWMWVLGLFDVIVVYYMIKCECWACLSDKQVRCKCWEKTYLVARPTTRMNEGWLYRTSCDEKNNEITHMMMTKGDLDRVMIQIQLWWLREIRIEWWSRSSPMMMIQIEWWPRSSSMTIHIKRWSRSRWLEDKMTLRCRWREDPEKKTSDENCVERIPS